MWTILSYLLVNKKVGVATEQAPEKYIDCTLNLN